MRAPFIYEINPDTGCYDWCGSMTQDGYGRWSKFMAHRAAYTRAYGEIPSGLHIDHLCRNRRCVNPTHLEAVTPRENYERGQSFARLNSLKTECPKGHPYNEANTYLRPDGGRNCRTCNAESVRALKRRKQAA